MSDVDKFPHKDVGVRLKAFRSTLDLNAKNFAALCGFNYTQYINWESGHRRMLPDDAKVLVLKFGLTMDFIYLGREQALPHNVIIALSSKSDVSAKSKSSDKPE